MSEGNSQLYFRRSLDGLLLISVEDIKLNFMEGGWESLCRFFMTPDHKKVNTFWRKINSELVIIFGTKIIFKWDELLFYVQRLQISKQNTHLES